MRVVKGANFVVFEVCMAPHTPLDPLPKPFEKYVFPGAHGMLEAGL